VKFDGEWDLCFTYCIADWLVDDGSDWSKKAKDNLDGWAGALESVRGLASKVTLGAVVGAVALMMSQ
jgi:hypothetical protein